MNQKYRLSNYCYHSQTDCMYCTIKLNSYYYHYYYCYYYFKVCCYYCNNNMIVIKFQYMYDFYSNIITVSYIYVHYIYYKSTYWGNLLLHISAREAICLHIIAKYSTVYNMVICMCIILLN